jgi:tetratricopeptide (TPR) repeat protein
MDKILKPYTIIPPNLYVERDADRQISSIIDDMGRPGYVLVSRQMGKTNLLLNAKRRLETPEDVFVYIDLSNPFETAKSCFDNIVDIALEANEQKIGHIKNEVYSRRQSVKDMPPHKLHTSELRLILNSIKGKLVIILDEIDALTKTPYSDQIFSQIRSIYFSRVNFPEFDRLTYILSGVVEPSEIIKDQKISPFNIGQKIFLNDFSKTEFELFLRKANLELSDEVRQRIFFWTNGNPRMTWDVCSEIETKKTKSTVISKDVDTVVSEAYLTAFDKPPIDNMRELVKNDSELRDAIVEIIYKKGKEVSDKIKNKLYLAGIINYEDSDVHIKNEIIKQSLNLDWIKSIEEEERGLVKIAFELYHKGKYTEALDTFERFLVENEFDEPDKALCYYHMAYAAYRNSAFPKALGYLENAVFSLEDETKNYFRALHLKALCYYYLGQFGNSLKNFKAIIDSGRKDDLYARALLNYGSISLKSNTDRYKEDANKIFLSIIDGKELNVEKLGLELVKHLKSIAYYNLGHINKSKKLTSLAVDNFKKAIELATEASQPTMLLELIEISKKEEREPLLNQIAELISTGKIVPVEEDPDKPIDFGVNTFRDILITSYLEFPQTVFVKLKPSLKLLGDKTYSKHLYDLAVYLGKKEKNWNRGRQILLSIYENFNNPEFELEEETRYKTLKLLAFTADIRKSESFHEEYFTVFRAKRFENVDYLDMEVLAHLIYILTQKRKYHEALEVVNHLNDIKPEVSEENLINYIAIYNLELNLYTHLNSFQMARQKAHQILELAKNATVKKQNSNLLGETGLDVIRKNAEEYIARTNPMNNRFL